MDAQLPTTEQLAQQIQDLQDELTNTQNTLHFVQQQQLAAANVPVPQPAISRKIEPFKDPGIYSSERAKFQEWWTKTKAWLAAYSGSFANNAKRCLAVWSRMEGPVAGVYAQAQIRKWTEANVWPPWLSSRRKSTSSSHHSWKLIS